MRLGKRRPQHPPEKRFVGPTGARALALALVGGVALSLAFPEPSVAPLAWIALAPLLHAARGATPARGFVLGLVFGAAFFGLLLVWISIVGWLGWFVLVLLQSLFIGIFGASWALLARRGNTAARVLLAATLWVALEYLRARVPVGGFTWGQLAQSQHNLGWMLESAGIAGGWGIAFVIAAANALVAEAWARLRTGAHRQAALVASAAAAVIASPSLAPASAATGRALDVAIVQGNVPREPGRYSSTVERELAIVVNHARLTSALADEDVDLVVWPESSVGVDVRHNENAARLVSGSARAVGVPMIVGGNLYVDEDRYKVVAFEVSPDGEIADVYQKTHLVPFGEYVPARDFWTWLPQLDQIPRDAIAGREPTLFEVAGGTVAPVLSFEGDFGSLVRSRIGAGGRLLVVATNTSTWGHSWASAQHLAFSQLRAAENGVWSVHAAISGISAFVAPDGSVKGFLGLWRAGSIVQSLRFARSVTLYARWGDWLPFLCLAASAVVLAAGAVGSRRERQAEDGSA